ncbi:MAG TPA: dCTP deaminase [Bryobacteraceae bacterium]|nr:dCTP deaminase [Bryobacteraceae bacterium]
MDARLKLPIGHQKSLVITPRVRPEDFDEDSVDLRLGCYFLLPKRSPEPYFAPDKETATSLHVKVHVPLGEYLVIPAHETVLGATLEFIKLPFDASGEILTKSSVARTFIVVETAPWIHPEYRGCLTLEIANVSNTPVLLYPGRPIGQLVLLKAARRHKKSAKLKGSYFGPVAPEPPIFRNPEDELFDLGAEFVSVIRKDQLRRRSVDFSCGVG